MNAAITTSYNPINVPGARTLADARPALVDGRYVSADVTHATGDYTVYVGGEVAAQGKLDGTEGTLTEFFLAEAMTSRI